MRKTYLSKCFVAGCFTCGGGEGIWFASNAQALAARHHDATGHTTWCDLILSYRYGDGDVFEEIENSVRAKLITEKESQP